MQVMHVHHDVVEVPQHALSGGPHSAHEPAKRLEVRVDNVFHFAPALVAVEHSCVG